MASAGAASLPTELFSAILDHLSLPQLITTSHVCARWRTAAHGHPLFWRDIHLRAMSPSALAFFEARLNSSTDKVGVSIFVHSDSEAGVTQTILNAIVLPAVERNLFRIARLALKLAWRTWVAMDAELFLRPAPMLQYLALECIDGSIYQRTPHSLEASVMVPNLLEASDDFHEPRLFSGFAPELRTLELVDILLDSTNIDISPALRNVETLRYEVDAPVDAKRVLAHFRSLRHLHYWAMAHEESARDLPSIAPPLASLHVWLGDGAYPPFFATFRDLSAVLHLSCPFHPVYPTDSLVLLALRGGPLKLAVSEGPSMTYPASTDYGFTFSAADGAAESIRTFYLNPIDLRIPNRLARVQGHLFSPDIRARITVLRLADRYSSLLPLLGELPACETIEILHAPGGGLQMMGSQTLRFAALRTVVLVACSPVPAPIPAEIVCSIILPIVGRRARSLEILLDGVLVTGDLSAAMSKQSWTRSAGAH
ncbi:hypothetical protein AURDEDRAFT_164582 [Auricularia subglabra TFB-10046 SS5]|nr:hypothetical protein AURDEDRAFT_164582 [Auricularia subglabra TFB-10046 SS5]